MKIVATRENFLKTISLAGQVINQRPNLPVLGSLLLTAESGRLEVVATDLETTISHKTPIKIEEAGRTTVPARTLIDFCQGAAGDSVVMETAKDAVMVKLGNANANLPSISPEEFPKLDQFDLASRLEIARSDLLESISSVIFCASPEIGRPVLSGVLFKTEGNALNLVATDGYRLAKKDLNIKGDLDAILPARALSEVARGLSTQDDDTVELSTDKEKNQIQFQTKDLIITTRLIEGEYPNYSQIIPTSVASSVRVGTKELAAAIKLASVFARDVGNVVRFEAAEKGLTIEASTAQIGEAETKLSASLEGEEIKLAFNSRFLIEGLAAIKGKETSINFSGITSAALMRGTEDKSLIYVVMPVRIQS